MRNCSCDVSTSILLLYSLVKNLPVSASTIHPSMTSHRMDNKPPVCVACFRSSGTLR